jgi:hypothetical protein
MCGQRSDIDDAPLAFFPHVIVGLTAGDEGCFQIDPCRLTPLFNVDSTKGNGPSTAGVVDQTKKTAAAVDDIAHEITGRFGGREIRRERVSSVRMEFPGGMLDAMDISSVQSYHSASGDQLSSNREPNSTT